MLLGWLEKSQGTPNPLGLADVAALTPLGGISTPPDIAHAVLFLCSPQASRITGAMLTVDGGFVLG